MTHLILTLALIAASPAQEPAPFHMVLMRTASGWSAHCDSGCSWKDVSAKCPAASCQVTIDDTGIALGAHKISEPVTFSFVVQRLAKGWQARSQKGTAWKTLSWNCPAAGNCRAQVGPDGVAGVTRSAGS